MPALDSFLPPGAIKRAEGEVEKDRGDDAIKDKTLVVGSALPGMAKLVGILSEEKSEDGKEKAGDFEPEDAAGVREGSPYGLTEFSCAARDGPALSRSLLNVSRSLLAYGMSALSGAVAEHAGGDADTDAEFAAETVGLHEQKCSSERLIRIAAAAHQK